MQKEPETSPQGEKWDIERFDMQWILQPLKTLTWRFSPEMPRNTRHAQKFTDNTAIT